MVTRGLKNVGRSPLRTVAITAILAVSIGLALVMLLSYQTIQAKIESVKSEAGSTLTVRPAGANGFEGGGEPLTDSQLADLKSLPHVSALSETLNDRLTVGTDTSLASAIDPGTLGNRQIRFNQNRFGGDGGGASGQARASQPRTLTIPIMITGVSDTISLTTAGANMTAGSLFDPTADVPEAVLGSTLASKNSLQPGSTFTAYSTTFTVKGIVDTGNTFGSSGLYIPIKTLQRLSDQAGDVSEGTVTADSLDNLSSLETVVKAKLGDKADVVSSADQTTQILQPLQNIKTISLYSLIGSLVAGAFITLLIMMMIVRERRREIGVLKAIGASTSGVVGQFMAEALALAILGALVGTVLGVALSNPVLSALVKSGTATATPAAVGAAGRGGQFFARVGQLGGISTTLQNIHATVSPVLIADGLLAAILIAVLGSAVPAWLIAQVKPAEAMRGE